MHTNPKVDAYLNRTTKWLEEVKQLRSIALHCQLTEELKWGTPCYTYNGNNVVLIHVFKEYCAFLFFKGALLNDPSEILTQPTENTQASRQIRFKNLDEIIKLGSAIKAYLYEAIEIEKAGLKVTMKKTSEFEMPVEFKMVLQENTALKAAFYGLTPGRQRAYLLHFSGAKQSKTRVSRIEKWIPQILNGKGMMD